MKHYETGFFGAKMFWRRVSKHYREQKLKHKVNTIRKRKDVAINDIYIINQTFNYTEL